MFDLNDCVTLTGGICGEIPQVERGDILSYRRGWAARGSEGAALPCWAGMYHITSLVFPQEAAESREDYGYGRFVQTMARLIERYAPGVLKG